MTTFSRLLGARDPDTGAAMDEQQVSDEALVFVLAGHETTSIALTFALDLLGRHPREQKLIHDEVDRVLGGRAPALDDVPPSSASRWRSRRQCGSIHRRRPGGDAPRPRTRSAALASPRLARGGEPVGDAPPFRVLGGPGGVRPLPLRARARGRAAPLRVLPPSVPALAPASGRTSPLWRR